MNCLAIFCLAAAVSAEADPYYLGGYGYGLGHAGLGYAGLGYGVLGHHAAGYASVSPSASVNIAGLAPAAVGGLYAGAGRYVANSAGTVHVAKREADPYYAGYNAFGYAGLGYAGYGGYGSPVVQAATPVHSVATVQSVNPVHSIAAVHSMTPVHNVHPVHSIAAVQAAVPVHNVPVVQSVTPIHNVAAVHDVAPVHNVAAVHAATPVQNVAAVHSGIPIHTVAGVNSMAPFNHVAGVPVHHGYNNANTQVSPSASLSIAGAAPAAVPGVVGARTYAGAGRYVANSAGTVHVAKREADPYYAGYDGIGYAGQGYT